LGNTYEQKYNYNDCVEFSLHVRVDFSLLVEMTVFICFGVYYDKYAWLQWLVVEADARVNGLLSYLVIESRFTIAIGTGCVNGILLE